MAPLLNQRAKSDPVAVLAAARAAAAARCAASAPPTDTGRSFWSIYKRDSGGSGCKSACIIVVYALALLVKETCPSETDEVLLPTGSV